MKLIIVTACPQGVATSFLAARALERAAQQKGWEARTDIRSPQQPLSSLAEDVIASADLVVAATGTPTDLNAYAGKRLYQVPVTAALPDPASILDQAEKQAEPYQPTDASQPEPATSGNAGKRIVAVTACPTGVAHTFMAAEALTAAATAVGHQIRVETQGSVGAQDPLTAEEIEAADVVILACDIEVDPSRFAGKRLWRTSTGSALKKPGPTIDDAMTNASVEEGQKKATSGGGGEKRGPYKHLLTGVSFMLPMVVAGGLLIALSFVFGIDAFEEEGTLAAALMQIGGGTAFQLMIPLLAGYIAWSIADRPGLAPGMIGGYLASTLGAGFLGGIIAGFLAGYVARFISQKLPMPESIESLKPILIIPLLASLVTGLAMIYVIGEPAAALMDGLTNFLEGMGTTNAILLGGILGAMMCFDLGGPVNKAAYTFGVGLLSEGSGGSAPMAAIMAAGMVPAIGMGVASFIARAKFAEAERQAGRASFVLGLCFISEGAIPFMAKDPLRVIPVCMVGGAITGALSMLFTVKLMAPHGGLFVLAIPNAVSTVLPYVAAIAIGSLVIGFGYAMIKTGKAEVATASS
ncbi:MULTISPECIES: PTS fructose-like transporter subunit IIB [Marinobacter]|jgi:PTS system fructose-specific IIC component|uniref:protein-N(pi)-phosphohistidine--D-fructose phosphotransferase n=2 Tax=Marinobacter salarius TaxID=1420917 RepID=W5YN42_9GAMM|nr:MULTISPECIES: PTS fructose-like transporter subunit IIB [Marinobacter]AHI30652.1 PTS fructose transporter subunit IIBC [Marinobacter salarius]KXJ43160.1 MAG: PTS fructose transporter subunit IIBC [Marinobacter sp. Hex_13]MBS8231209.1 PTS fructose-like transporter subunit IIB [Marinobacter salarius]SFL72184.1 PTS system, fructose-specific IIC component [Marinobacter salarius]|tara:strand:+ start:1036 stop:2775 length:1740 start_codon:yes stop_codon:yes gene_type:complete